MSFISKPMGWILSKLSILFGHNFAVSVLVFTILVNLIMLPLTLKTQKSTAKQAKIKHKLDALKKKYGDDRQKYSVAMQELYNKEGISMGGGCMPMIIRLILMMGVYYAIMSPFTYVANLDKNALKSATDWTAYARVVNADTLGADTWEELGLNAMLSDETVIKMASKTGSDVEHCAKMFVLADVSDSESDTAAVTAAKKAINEKKVTREVEIAEYVDENNKLYEPVIVEKYIENGGSKEELYKIDFNMFGIDLRGTPDFSWNIIQGFEINWLIPLASFAASLLTGITSSILQKKANPEAPNMMAMMIVMPLFSLYIAFGFPCAVGFYWACSSLVSGCIQIVTQIFYGPAVVNARAQAKSIVAVAKKENEIIARAENGRAE